jgi:hypothetical protein
VAEPVETNEGCWAVYSPSLLCARRLAWTCCPGVERRFERDDLVRMRTFYEQRLIFRPVGIEPRPLRKPKLATFLFVQTFPGPPPLGTLKVKEQIGAEDVRLDCPVFADSEVGLSNSSISLQLKSRSPHLGRMMGDPRDDFDREVEER